MNEIKCPGCGEKFKIDDSSYLKILEQAHNQEFEKQVKLLEENSLVSYKPRSMNLKKIMKKRLKIYKRI